MAETASNPVNFAMEIAIAMQTEQFNKGVEDVIATAQRAEKAVGRIGAATLANGEAQLEGNASLTTSLELLSKRALALNTEYRINKSLGESTAHLGEQYHDIREKLSAIKDSQEKMSDLSKDQISSLQRTNSQLGQFEKSFRESNSLVLKMSKGLNDMGAKGLARLVEGFASVKGTIVSIIAVLIEYAKLEGEVANAQMRQFGNVRKTAAMVNELSGQYGVLKETGIKTAQALASANMELSETDFSALAGEIAMISEATGFSAESMTKFSKGMQIAGASVEQTKKSLASFSYVATQFGLDASESAAMMKKVSDNALKLRMAFGTEGVIKYSKTMGGLAAQAKKFGGDVSGVTDALDQSMETGIAYSIALGKDAMFKSASENAVDLQKNIGKTGKRYNEFFEGKFAKYPEKLAEIFNGNMAIADLARRSYLEHKSFMEKKGATEEKWGKFIENRNKKEQDAAALATQQRESAAKAWTALTASLTSAFNSLLMVLRPIFIIIEYIAKAFLWLQEVSDGWAGPIIMGALVLLVVMTKLRGTVMAFGSELWKLGGTLGGVFAKAKNMKIPSFRAAMRGLAQGIVQFLQQIGKIKPMDLFKAILVLAVLGGFMIGMGILADRFDAKLIDAAIGMVGIAVAIRLLGNTAKDIEVAPIAKLAFVTWILAGTMIGLAFAVSLTDGGLLSASIAMIALMGTVAYSLTYLGKLGEGAKGSIKGLLIIGLAMLILSAMLAIMGLAMMLVGDPDALVKILWSIVGITFIMAIIGALAAAVGPMILIGAAVMVAGLLILVGGLLLLSLVDTDGMAGTFDAISTIFTKLGEWAPQLAGIMWDFLAGVVVLGLVGVAMLAAAPGLLIGGIAFAAAVVPIAGALWLLKKATQGFSPSRFRSLGRALSSFVDNVSDAGVGFVLSAHFMASGLETIAEALQEYGSVLKNVSGFEILNEFLELINTTSVDKMEDFADSFEDTLEKMAKASEKYGGKIGASLIGLDFFKKASTYADTNSASDAPVAESETVTYQTKKSWWQDISDSPEKDRQYIELREMNGKLDKLIAAIGINASKEILTELQQYLPEIADSDITGKSSSSWMI